MVPLTCLSERPVTAEGPGWVGLGEPSSQSADHRMRRREVDRSTTRRFGGLWADKGTDEMARQRPGGHGLEAFQDLAKVRVAGSNPVVRSQKCW
jgi:hypothetical protein